MLHPRRSHRLQKPTQRRFLPRGLKRWAAALLTLSASARAAPVLTERDGTLRVCNLGPDAAMSRAMRLHGSAEVKAAEVLPNPSLVMQHQRTLSGPSERETIVGLSVPFGVSGRRGLLIEAAAARREQAFAEGDAALFESALAFRAAFSRALMAQARAQISSEQQAALDASSVAIEALAKGGEAAGYDLLRQRVQARSHRASVDVAKARALASRADLASWLETEVELPALDLAALARASTLPPAAGPEPQTRRLQSLLAASRAHELEARAARRRSVPDPELFAGYRTLDGDGDIARGISLSLTIPLTVFDHGQGDAARADAERSLAEAAAEQLERQQGAQVKSARARLQQLSSGIADLGRARTEAEELLRQSQRLYSAGEASITEMLEAFRAAEEARLAELDRVFELVDARLLLMQASGTMFDAELDRACRRGEPRKP
jgi:cobalt-zinc-cadmium efflux system outer membrane protein